MKNRFSIALTLVLLLSGLDAYSQTKDSSNAEIKKQALEMREKLNKYMADKLMVEEVKKDTGLKVFFDSISLQLHNQKEEIEKLKQQFNRLEQALINGEVYTSEGGHQKGKGRKGRGGSYDGATEEEDSIVLVQGFQRYGERQLNLYFAFDSYTLSKKQKQAVADFIKGKQITKRVTIQGFTDWMGTESHNATLAENRCKALIKRLNILKIHYKTSTRFKCDVGNEYTPGKAQWCRRVELIINQ